MNKKIRKIITTLMLMVVVVSTVQSKALASDANANETATPAVETTGTVATPGAYNVEVALYLMESNDNWSFGDIAPKEWSEPKSESVIIKEDGTYTLSLTDLDIPGDKFMLCYIKDVAAYPKDTTVTHSNVPDDLMVITNEFKVNGSVKEVNDKVRTGLKAGIFDVAYQNSWDDNDNCVSFGADVNSVELTFTVTGLTGEPGALQYEPTQAPATPTVAAVASDATSNVTDTSTSEADESRNTLPVIIGIVVVLILVAAVIFVVRKKK